MSSQRKDRCILTSKERSIKGISASLCLAITLIMGTVISGFIFVQNTHAAGMSMQPFPALPASYQPQSHITHRQAASSQLPTWTSSFSYNGKIYPYRMIGTDPSQGSATTTVPVTIVPLKIVFSDGTTFDGSQQVTNVLNSPLFQAASFSSGDTQFGDAMQRAEFWKIVSKSSSDYHVLLAAPTIAPVVTIHVPATDGSVRTTANGVVIGTVYFGWFNSKLEGLLGSDGIAPNMLAFFLSYNVLTFFDRGGSGCCLAGFHQAIYSSLQTFIWSSYLSPGIFPGMEDINFLSHEVAEWMNDPFNNNVVPSYKLPFNPQGTCQSLLEVGDPLIGIAYEVEVGGTVYHPQDITFLSWFARQAPSEGIHGRYTYRGMFKTFAPACP